MGISAKKTPAECQAFARAYMVDRDPIGAYLQVHPRATLGTAALEGPRSLQRADVQALLQMQAASPSSRPDELHLRSAFFACRHSHGVNHRHQQTQAEMDQARGEHGRLVSKWEAIFRRHRKVYPAKPFDERGGGGFNPARPPHPGCPECFGKGVARLVVVDASTGRASLVEEMKRPQILGARREHRR